MLDAPAGITLSGTSAAYGQPVQNLDDDGCFCCCTHILAGAHSVLVPAISVVPVSSPTTVLNPLAVAQSPFHPPKQ
jgi:hypothetical protein